MKCYFYKCDKNYLLFEKGGVGVRGGWDDSGPSGCEGDYLLVEPLISL